jgi:hypothetical protein
VRAYLVAGGAGRFELDAPVGGGDGVGGPAVAEQGDGA